MKKIQIVSLLAVVLLFVLSACSIKNESIPAVTTSPLSTATATIVPAKTPQTIPTGSTGSDLSRSDSQGAVTVVVNPLTLNPTGDTLVFEVSMDTHSVDLSMDLAKLATLSTDNGKTIQAIQWDGPASGGHHVSGKLTFPTFVEQKPVLLGVKQLTLTIKDVDAASRTFTWPVK